MLADAILLDGLQKALTELQREREDALKQSRQLKRRMEQIQDAIAALDGPSRTNGAHARSAADRSPASFAVGEDRVSAVQEYLQAHERARQADIGIALGINSGSVSVALRLLEQRGQIAKLDRKERGSSVWESLRVPATV